MGTKRKWEEPRGYGTEVVAARSTKRGRLSKDDLLGGLSDELLLRALSFLSINDLVLCDRVSARIRRLSTDAQIWKALYYDRFVRPRAARIPAVKDGQPRVTKPSLHYASRLSRWLEDEGLIQQGNETDWKRQYKLRHNWARGCARVTETQVADQPTTPPLLICLDGCIIAIADADCGLRVWITNRAGGPVAKRELQGTGNSRKPTSMAIDSAPKSPRRILISLGFDDGSFSVYRYRCTSMCLEHLYSHASSSNGTIDAIALCFPYCLTMTAQARLSMYKFPCEEPSEFETDYLSPPLLLCSLVSHAANHPVTLALRQKGETLTASIAYAMPSWITRWTVGIQEIQVALDGTILTSRIASARPQTSLRHDPDGDRASDTILGDARQQIDAPLVLASRPSSLSYNHPYLLTAHPDNTLTLYMVTTTPENMQISQGHRLWGHTSAVSGAHIGDRGKAVSVSSRGHELRVWELEGRAPSWPNIRSLSSVRGGRPIHLLPDSSLSVQVNSQAKSFPALQHPHDSLAESDESESKGWLAFDSERVFTLREKAHGAQALVVYDFS